LTNAKDIMSRYIKRIKVETKNRSTNRETKRKERQKEIMSRNIKRLKVET
jgi:hypothetical protein